MRGWALLFVTGFGAVLAWKIGEDSRLLLGLLVWLGTLATMLVTAFALAMVMRYSRASGSPARPASSLPSSPYILDQPPPYQALPGPPRPPVDTGRTELLPNHFTDTIP
jgi:hypothetical protein